MAARTAIALWAVVVAISAIYVLPSGMPQLSDALAALVVALVFAAGPRISPTTAMLVLAWFAYVFIVNLTWWTIEDDRRLLFSTAYYAFNLLVMLTVASILTAKPNHFIRWTRAALLVSITLEFAAVIVTEGFSIRAVGTFNNPNQLAYWSLLVSAIWFALKPAEPLHATDVVILVVAVLFCLASGSRAGLLGVGIMIIVAIAFHGISARVWLAIGAVTIFAVILGGYVAETILEQPAVQRFGEERPHDTLASRGYDRFWLFPQYIILGAGEGAFDRFEHVSQGGELEIHSTFAQLVFSYGIAGTCIFAALLVWVFRGSDRRYLAYLAPVAVYGLTHNGIRAPLLWAFFGVVVGLGQLRRDMAQAQSTCDRQPISVVASQRTTS